jgi:hypothetical protein
VRRTLESYAGDYESLFDVAAGTLKRFKLSKNIRYTIKDIIESDSRKNYGARAESLFSGDDVDKPPFLGRLCTRRDQQLEPPRVRS